MSRSANYGRLEEETLEASARISREQTDISMARNLTTPFTDKIEQERVNSSRQTRNTVAGGACGAAVGAGAGAVLGSIVPGIGTYVGAVAGAAIGGGVGGAYGGGLLSEREPEPEPTRGSICCRCCCCKV